MAPAQFTGGGTEERRAIKAEQTYAGVDPAAEASGGETSRGAASSEDPVAVAMLLWDLVGGTGSPLQKMLPVRRGASPREAPQPGWGYLALDVFESLVATLLDPEDLSRAAEAAAAHQASYSQCAQQLLRDVPQVYRAVTSVRGLAVTLDTLAGAPPLDGYTIDYSLPSGCENWSSAPHWGAPGTQGPLNGFAPAGPSAPSPDLQPGLPLRYDVLVL